jgi:hypothetical protein
MNEVILLALKRILINQEFIIDHVKREYKHHNRYTQDLIERERENDKIIALIEQELKK